MLFIRSPEGVQPPAEPLTTRLRTKRMADEEYGEDAWAAPAWMGIRSGYLDAPRESNLPNLVKKRYANRLRTSGYLAPGKPAVVYVAGEDGRVKVGMTTDVASREANLRTRIRFVLSVVPDAARDVEGLALTKLGRSNLLPGEWVSVTLEEAQTALCEAWHAVARYRRVDPDITEDDARRQRIRACAASAVSV